MDRTTIFRSTDSRRARNSASVMIDRRRFAFRPSLRRCRLASKRVEPFSAVTSSPEPPLSPREPRPPRRRRRRRELPLDSPDSLPFPFPLPFPAVSASLSCAVAFLPLLSGVEPEPLPESDFPLLLALFSSESPDSLSPSLLSVPAVPPEPPEPPEPLEPFRRPRPPRRRRRLPPPDGPGSPSAPWFEDSSPAFSPPCSSCSASSAAPAPVSAAP